MMEFAKSVWSFLKTLALAAFLAFFCIRGFVFEPFKIPSSSMMPTLLIGDFLIVTKFAYGNRLPLTDYFFWQREPERGDIVVFKRKDNSLPGSFFGFGETLFIKRLVGLPGDRIAYDRQTLFINGEAIEAKPEGVYEVSGPTGAPIRLELMEENLKGVRHAVLRDPNQTGPEVAEMVVPEGMYVMMGDNRDNSRDSRYWEWPSWSFVPKADLMGRAEFIFWSWDENWVPRLERIGNGLRRNVAPEGVDGAVLDHARGGQSA